MSTDPFITQRRGKTVIVLTLQRKDCSEHRESRPWSIESRILEGTWEEMVADVEIENVDREGIQYCHILNRPVVMASSRK